MIIDLGLIDYEKAYVAQRRFVGLRKLKEIEDSLLIAEHPPVFTLGRTGKIENLLVSGKILRERNIKVLATDRGGDITFHGPGQIVLYPIIDLKKREKDLHKYLRDLEEAVIDFLKGYSVIGERIKGRTGVWVGEGKVASIGVAASNWITYHGVSVNIDVDKDFFSMMHPCGLKGSRMMNLAEISDRRVSIMEAKEKLLHRFERVFALEGEDFARRFSAVA